ncbi:hypothetical protein [Pararhodobacter sp. SW119]|uniref:hypothetical protein n=1 Tax=Pararhodobacter sp. SW119 TaxID=2780075 RepID=UPI001AE07B93|nr:hypothetical protein [Pararhodobacter sp. SW119]
MSQRTVTALQIFLRPHVDLSKSRLETLCLLLVGMISARTVNLGHIACEREGTARIASTYRRLQRFFQHVRLGPDWALPLVARLLGSDRRWTLVLDRTQWAIGKREVNYLVLAVVTRHFRVPVLWTLLPRSGNSGTAARIALVERYLAHFPVSSVAILLADREFIGARWLNFLDNLQIKRFLESPMIWSRRLEYDPCYGRHAQPFDQRPMPARRVLETRRCFVLQAECIKMGF